MMRKKPLEAADLAHLALDVAGSLDVGSYGEERIQDFRAAAWSALGNAKRLAGDLSGAGKALEAAGEALACGTGDLLEQANTISIRASLQNDLGDPEGATVTLRRANHLALTAGARHLAARFTLQQSSCIAPTSSGRAGCWIWRLASPGAKEISRRSRGSFGIWSICMRGLISISISRWPRSISRRRSAFKVGGTKRPSFWVRCSRSCVTGI